MKNWMVWQEEKHRRWKTARRQMWNLVSLDVLSGDVLGMENGEEGNSDVEFSITQCLF